MRSLRRMKRMTFLGRCVLGLAACTAWAALGGASAALAQAGPQQAAPAASAASAPAAGSERRVIEDDGVRIEELRIRGEVRSVTVQSKLGGTRPYEVLVRRNGRDPSQDRSGAGHSVWSLFSF